MNVNTSMERHIKSGILYQKNIQEKNRTSSDQMKNFVKFVVILAQHEKRQHFIFIVVTALAHHNINILCFRFDEEKFFALIFSETFYVRSSIAIPICYSKLETRTEGI